MKVTLVFQDDIDDSLVLVRETLPKHAINVTMNDVAAAVEHHRKSNLVFKGALEGWVRQFELLTPFRLDAES